MKKLIIFVFYLFATPVFAEVTMQKPIFLHNAKEFSPNQIAIERETGGSKNIGKTVQLISLRDEDYKIKKKVSAPYVIKEYKKESIPKVIAQMEVPDVIINTSGYILEPLNAKPYDFGYGTYVITGIKEILEVEEIEAAPSQVSKKDFTFLESKFKFPLKAESIGSLHVKKLFKQPISLIEYNNKDYYIINIVCLPERGIDDYGYFKPCINLDRKEIGSYFYNRKTQQLTKLTTNYVLQNIHLITNKDTVIVYGDIQTCKSCGFSQAYHLSKGKAIRIYMSTEEGT